MGITEGQWNLLSLRRIAEPEAITANDSDISVSGGKVLYGLDAAGNRHLLVPVLGGEIGEDHESQGVQVGVRALQHEGRTSVYADLVCLRPRLNVEFGHVVDEVMVALAAGAAPAAVCRISLEKWRDLLRPGRAGWLEERTAIGLFGELAVLRDLARLSPYAVSSWTGPGGGRFDFTGADVAVEVKTSTRRYGRLVEVSGETQLDAPQGLALYLNFIRLESVPAGGERLWDLLAAILAAGASAGELQKKIDGLDLDEGVLRNDSRRYRILETRLYSVDEGFPKIVPSSFTGGELPAGTLRLRYMIDLSGEPPGPLDRPATDAVFRKLAQGRDDGDPA